MTAPAASSGAMTPSRDVPVAYSILLGLATLTVLLQGVWAGIFIREGKANNDHWVSVHAHGADVAIVLAAVATIVAFARARQRRDLWIGTGVFTILLVLEAFIGGLIGNHPGAEVVHFPLAMGLLGLAVWLPMRARYGRRT